MKAQGTGTEGQWVRAAIGADVRVPYFNNRSR